MDTILIKISDAGYDIFLSEEDYEADNPVDGGPRQPTLDGTLAVVTSIIRQLENQERPQN